MSASTSTGRSARKTYKLGSTRRKTLSSASSTATGDTTSTNTPADHMRLWTPEAKQAVRNRTESVDWFAKLDRQMKGQWSYFLTMTFREAIPRHLSHIASSKLISFCSAWATLSGGKHFKFLLWSAEEHMTGSVHLHALSVNSREPIQRHCEKCLRALSCGPEWKILKESWFMHHGIARVFPYKPELRFGAERYVTKYVLDEKCLDWGIETWED